MLRLLQICLHFSPEEEDDKWQPTTVMILLVLWNVIKLVNNTIILVQIPSQWEILSVRKIDATLWVWWKSTKRKKGPKRAVRRRKKAYVASAQHHMINRELSDCCRWCDRIYGYSRVLNILNFYFLIILFIKIRILEY